MSADRITTRTALKGRNRSSHPRRLNATKLGEQALDLKRAGLSFGKIALKLGVAKSTIVTAFNRAMETWQGEIDAKAEAMRALDVRRLEFMLSTLEPRLQKGDDRAIDRAIKILERRARLLGYDAPMKIAPVTPDGATPLAPVTAVFSLSETQLNGMTIEQLTQLYQDHAREKLPALPAPAPASSPANESAGKRAA